MKPIPAIESVDRIFHVIIEFLRSSATREMFPFIELTTIIYQQTPVDQLIYVAFCFFSFRVLSLCSTTEIGWQLTCQTHLHGALISSH